MRAFMPTKVVISFDLRKSLRAKTRGFRDYEEQTSAKVKQDTTRFMAKRNAIYGKRNAFCIKTSSILGQNAFYFGSKRILFWAKTHSILGQNAALSSP